MDTSATDISFNDAGTCNFCAEFLEAAAHITCEDGVSKDDHLSKLVNSIKKMGANKQYDCIVGVSGGVDSSWVLVKAVELGLRPLPVHMDNSWNSELAQNNISNLVKLLKLDLYTYVIDWQEYKKLMQSFFNADVIDIELLYDNAMLSVCYQQARKYGIKYILAGTNFTTEGMRMPSNWNWYKRDVKNIRAIAKKFQNVKIKTFPTHSTIDYIIDLCLRRIKWISFLDYYEFNKFEALNVLERDYGYKRYPYKHYESIFTRFYQGYILPRKFNVDKRLIHLSTLVVSGQITRNQALDGLKGIAYLSDQDMNTDIEYFLKKMGWGREDLDRYIKRPGVAHDRYINEKWIYNFLNIILSSTLKAKITKMIQG